MALFSFRSLHIRWVFFLALLFSPNLRCLAAQNTTQLSEYEIQNLVMKLADHYSTALGEAVHSAQMEAGELDPAARALLHGFLRNGSGAAVDIAVSSEPRPGLVNILTLASLQTEVFQTRWGQKKIPASVRETITKRLKAAEVYLWTEASKVLTDEQLSALDDLIESWLEENPDQVIVSLVRFDEISALLSQQKEKYGIKIGILFDFSQTRESVDEIRLLAERALWFASRYPYLVGQQSELTAYRLLNESEVTQTLRNIERLQQRVDSISQNIAKLNQTLLILPNLSNDVAALAKEMPDFDQLETAINSLANSIAEIDRDIDEIGIKDLNLMVNRCLNRITLLFIVLIASAFLFLVAYRLLPGKTKQEN